MTDFLLLSCTRRKFQIVSFTKQFYIRKWQIPFYFLGRSFHVLLLMGIGCLKESEKMISCRNKLEEKAQIFFCISDLINLPYLLKQSNKNIKS